MPRLQRLCAVLFALGLLGLGTRTVHSEEETSPTHELVRLVSDTSLSADGSTLYFAWRSDLWRAPVQGGAIEQLTSHPARDRRPRLSPDGRVLAFTSNREGSDQVFVRSVEGGTPRPVTSHSEGTWLEGWYPDGSALLAGARRDHDWRRSERLFRIDLTASVPPALLFDAYGSNAALSPDATRVAFTREGVGWARKGYRGSQASQVWIHDLAAGTFERITDGYHGERWPLWSADGRRLYVTSQASGTFNLVAIDLATGARSALTSYADDGVLFPEISADGSTIVFRRLFDLHRLDVGSGKPPVRIELHYTGDPLLDPVLHHTLTKATDVAFTDDAREIAFIAGGDVWVMDTELREPRRVTDTPEEERDVVFGPDHEGLYFVSDVGGEPDIHVARRADPAAWWWQNDSFETTRITDDTANEDGLSFTPDGERMLFRKGLGSLWSVKLDGSDPRRHVEAWDGVGYDVSPDGQWLAWSANDAEFNRDVWIGRMDGTGEPFNVSRHPDYDGSPSFSPDGKLLAFTGRRWRTEQDICFVWLRAQDEETTSRDRRLEKALERMKGRKAKPKPKAPAASPPDTPPADAPPPVAPPDRDPVVGVWVGHVRGDAPVPDEGLPFRLEVTRADDGSLGGTIAVGEVFTGPLDAASYEVEAGRITFSMVTPLGPLSGEAQIEGDALDGTWTIEGFASGTLEARRQTAEPEAPPSDPPVPADPETPTEAQPKAKAAAKAKAVPEVVIDFEGLEDRIHRISIPNASESRLLWSPDSKRLAFQATVEGSRGVYTVSFPDSLRPKRLTTTLGTHARWLKEGNQIVWLDAGKPASLSSSGKGTSWPFRVDQAVDLEARNGAAFEQAWRVMRDEWYDPRMNNRDWDAIRTKYGTLARETRRPEDLEQIVGLMLGELNGSHLGFSARKSRWSRSGWTPVTRHLGARFETDFEGPGWRIRDVVPDTPAASVRHRLEAGETILEVNGTAVGPAVAVEDVLTLASDAEVTLEVQGASGETRTVTLRPTTYGAVRGRLYDKVLEERRALAETLSDGHLGYVHVRGMNWGSFELFEEALYKAGHGKDGLIIDVRDNGGGFTADHLLTVLSQPRHARTVPRGGSPGYPQDRMVYARWWKPIVVLCNQNSFSNAEIFAHAVRTLQRGKIVGVPTAGGVVSTGSTSIMDLGTLRLPFRGWFDLTTGEDMERNGCVPDVVVWPEPSELPAGRDRQLEAAVRVLRRDVEAAQASSLPRPRYASEREDAR